MPGGWRESGVERVVDLVDITIGVIGAGMVGRHFLELLRPFEVDVVVSDPNVPEGVCQALGARKVELEELLRISDIVSIHAPSIPSTDNMINAETLKLMKKNAGLINTSRGSLVNEQDLYAHMSAATCALPAWT